MKQVNVTVEGKDDLALLVALEQVKRAIEDGFSSGMDTSDDSSYQFNIIDSDN